MTRPVRVELVRPGMKLLQSDGTFKEVQEAKPHRFRNHVPVTFTDGTRDSLPVNTLVEVEE
jgi:hypothetical protein